ncbi:MAG: SWIM zinc finger family protein [Acidimicrobiales bacterium]
MSRRRTVRTRSRRAFGRTWWGTAWVDALEGRARLDPNRLPRGRTYARHGRVGALRVESGVVWAPVQGSRDRAYRTKVRVRPFTTAEWEAVLDAIAARAGHAAALLDGELDPGIVEDVARASIELLPGPGELRPWCSCPDWADPCKHAAAVCYLVADLLDDDPFVLLLLRGRPRPEVLAGLRARRAGPGVDRAPGDGRRISQPVDEGVVARVAFAVVGSAADLPATPRPPSRPGRPVPLPTDPPAGLGVDPAALLAVATDAAMRAWELATGASDGGLGATARPAPPRRPDG